MKKLLLTFVGILVQSLAPAQNPVFYNNTNMYTAAQGTNIQVILPVGTNGDMTISGNLIVSNGNSITLGGDARTNWPTGSTSAEGIWASNHLAQVELCSREPMGICFSINPTFYFTNVTRTLVLDNSTNWYYWYAGIVYTNPAVISLSISTNIGTHYLYYDDASGTLKDSVSPWNFSNNVQVATVLWDGNQGLVANETHGMTMDWRTHEYLHDTIRTRYETGFAGTFTTTNFSIGTGTIHDEDLQFTYSTLTNGMIITHTNGVIYMQVAAGLPFMQTPGGSIVYDTGTTTNAVAAGQYVAYWIFVGTTPSYPIQIIPGQRVDSTLANARANNTLETLLTAGLPMAEMKSLYRLIFHRANGTGTLIYDEAQDLRAVSAVPTSAYVAQDHGTLAGLLDDDHPQYLLVDGTRSMAGTLDLTGNNLTNVGTGSFTNLFGSGAQWYHDSTATSTLYTNVYRRVLYDGVTSLRVEDNASVNENVNLGTMNFYVTNGMTWTGIRTLFGTIPRGNYGTINIYFADGTYRPDAYADSPLALNLMYGGGTTYIYGNTGETATVTHTNQAVILDASTNYLQTVFQLGQASQRFEIRNIRVRPSCLYSSSYGFAAWANSFPMYYYGCYVDGQNITTNTYGFGADRAAYVQWNACSVQNVKYGFGALNGSTTLEYDNVSVGTLPAYGYALYNSTMKHLFRSYLPPFGSTGIGISTANDDYTLGALTANRTLYVSNTWSVAQINSLFSCLTKDLNAYTLTIQYPAGTFLLTDTGFLVRGFLNGGINIYGNNDGTGKYTSQTTKFIATTNSFTELTVARCTAPVTVKDIAFVMTNSNTAAWYYCVNVLQCPQVNLSENYFRLWTNVTCGGIQAQYANALSYQNVFENGYMGMVAGIQSQGQMQDCTYTNKPPFYGTYCDQGRMTRYDWTPVTTNLYCETYSANSGFTVFPGGTGISEWTTDATLWPGASATWAQRAGTMPTKMPRCLTSIFMRSNVGTGYVQVCYIATNATTLNVMGYVQPTTSGAYGTISASTLPQGGQLVFNITGYDAASYTTQSFMGGVSGTYNPW